MKEKGPRGLFLVIRGDFMGIKLIATDMDGTFLDDEKKYSRRKYESSSGMCGQNDVPQQTV